MHTQVLLIFVSLLLLPCLNGAEKVFNKRFGGGNQDYARAVATDSDGNVYVAGSTSSLNFPVKGGIQQRNGGAAPLISIDSGESWDTSVIDAAVYSVTPVGARLYAGTSNGIYLSDHLGRTWARISPSINYTVRMVWVDPRTPTRLVAASARGVLISNDSGVTWRESNQGIEDLYGQQVVRVISIASPQGSPDTLFAVVDTEGISSGFGFANDIVPNLQFVTESNVYRSMDSGTTWAKLNLMDGMGHVRTMVADPANPDVLYASLGISGVVKTSDGGNTWQMAASIELNYWHHTIAIAQGNIYAARRDGVSRSTDGGETWSDAGLQGENVNAVAADPENGLTAWALASGVIYRTIDGGVNWTQVGPPVSPNLDNIAVVGQTVLVSGDPGDDAFLTKWDPTASQILFSTYLGGSGLDRATGIAVDAEGNIWLAGNTSSMDFPVTDGSTLTGEQNAFVAKLSGDGLNLLYASYLGGSTWETVSALAVDESGAAYIAGFTESADFPVTAGAMQTEYKSSCSDPLDTFPEELTKHGDAFVAKIASGGGIEFATYLGGSCGDMAEGIALDSLGNVYVTGFTSSPDFPVTDGASQTTYAGGIYDGFIAKLHAGGGRLEYATFLGDDGADNVGAVTVDADGAAYITGNSALSQPDPSSSCGSTSLGVGRDLPHITDAGIFMAKLKPDGSERVLDLLVGGDCAVRSTSIALGASGNIWIGGHARWSHFSMVAPVQAFGLGDGFLTQIDPLGTEVLFSTLTEGSYDMVIGATGDIYTAGYSQLGTNTMELMSGQYRMNSAVVTRIDPSRTFPLQLDTPARINQSVWWQPFSSQEGAAPGQVLRLTGSKLGPAEPMSAELDVSGEFPKSLGGVEVRFDGEPATILSAGDTEIVCITPFSLDGLQESTIQVSYNGEVSNPVGIAVKPVSLDILAVVNPDWSLNSHNNPAPAGSHVVVFITGMGMTDPPGVDGHLNQSPGRMLNPLTVTLNNNLPAEVLYAGPSPGLVAGIGQINIALPVSLESGILRLHSGRISESLYVYVGQ